MDTKIVNRVALRWVLAGMLLAAAAYLLSLPGGFLYDDWYLFGLPDVVDPDGWRHMFRLEATRPLGTLSFWVSYQLSGESAWAWRLSGIVMHLANAALLYQAFRGAVPSEAAAWAAVLFAVHPTQTEAVCYVSARPGLLSVHFILWSLWLWFRGRHYGAAAAFAVALLCKEDAVAYPLALGLMHSAWSRNRRELGAIGLMLGLSVAAGLRLLFAAAVVKDSGVGADAGVSWWGYLGSQGWAWWTYLRGLVLPWGFSMEPPVEGGWMGLAAWVVCGVGLGWMAHRAVKGSPAAVWGLVGWVLLLPSSSVMPAADGVAFRRMYLPMVAVSVAAGFVVRSRVLILAMVPFLAVQTWVWKDPVRVAESAVAASPDALRPYVQWVRLTGREADLRDQERRWGGEPAFQNQLGSFALDRGDLAEALTRFGQALALEPGSRIYRTNRALVLARLGQADVARRDVEQVLRADPCFWPAIELRLRLARPPDVPEACRLTKTQRRQLTGR